MVGLFQENGPCIVNIDSSTVSLNPWSWNNEVNMLYIDQPVQTGFSYDSLLNVTIDQTTGSISPLDPTAPIPAQNYTYIVGTVPSQDPTRTANDTQNAARCVPKYFVLLR